MADRTPDRIDIALRPRPTMSVRITAAGALFRVEAASFRNDGPIAGDLRELAAVLTAQADQLEAEGRAVPA